MVEDKLAFIAKLNNLCLERAIQITTNKTIKPSAKGRLKEKFKIGFWLYNDMKLGLLIMGLEQYQDIFSIGI